MSAVQTGGAILSTATFLVNYFVQSQGVHRRTGEEGVFFFNETAANEIYTYVGGRRHLAFEVTELAVEIWSKSID